MFCIEVSKIVVPVLVPNARSAVFGAGYGIFGGRDTKAPRRIRQYDRGAGFALNFVRGKDLWCFVLLK